MRRIGVAASIWGTSILASRLIGLVREAVLGRQLGAGAEADAYWTAFIVPDFLNYLLAGGALSIVFIPIFAARARAGSTRDPWDSFSAIANALGLALLVLVGVAWLAMPALAPLVAPGFDPAGRARVVELSRIVLLAQPFHVLGGLLAAALQARDRHLVPALAPLVYNAAIVLGGLLGGAAHGALGFAWGVVAGSVLGPFLLPLLACRALGMRWRARLEIAHPDLAAYLVRSLPIMLGFSIVVVDDWYLRREGSRLGPGIVSVLSYAKSLMRVPVGVVGLAAGVAAYPTLVRLVAEGRAEEMKRTLLATLRVLVLLSLAAELVLFAAGTEIVSVIYGSRRLDPERVRAIASAMSWVALGLAAWSVQALLARAFYALGNTWMPALLGTAVALVAYPVYALLGTHLGANGLALASALAILAYATLLLAVLERRHVPLSPAERRAALAFALRALLALASAALLARVLQAALPPASNWTGTLVRGAALALSSAAVFLGSGLALGLAELRTLMRRRADARARF